MTRSLVGVLLFCVVASATAQTSVSISSVDRASAATLSLITIQGNGFDTSTAISVIFSARDAVTATVPVVTASPTSIRVAVPPLINRTTGNLMDTSVVVDVQVVQVTASSITTSNTLGGLTVEAPPTSNDPPGTFTRAFLRMMLDVQTDLRRGRQGASGFGDVLSSSQRFTDAQASLLNGVELILRTPEATANIPARDNWPLLLNQRALRAMDRVGTAFVQQANSSFKTSSGGPITSSTCACNPITEADRWLCEFRQNACVAYDVGRRVVQEGAVGSYGAEFSLLGAWSAGGLSGAAPETSAGLSFLVAQAMAYSSAILAGIEPIGTWGLLRDNGASLFDDLNNSGLAIFLGLQVSLEMTQQIETAVARTTGMLTTAPQGGLVMPAPTPASPPANTRPARVYSGSGVGPKWIATPITQTTTPITSATIPAASVGRFDGNYSGGTIVTCTISGPDIGTMSQSAQDSISVTVSNGSITGGGSVSDTGRFTAPPISASGITCTTGGSFWSVGPGPGEAGGNGFINCNGGVPGATISCSGTWIVTRR